MKTKHSVKEASMLLGSVQRNTYTITRAQIRTINKKPLLYGISKNP